MLPAGAWNDVVGDFIIFFFLSLPDLNVCVWALSYRVLGFRRTMPVVGRVINITADIFDHTTDGLMRTFFVSPEPDNNHCFFGHCKSYCDVFHPVCGDKDQLEVRRLSFVYCANYFISSVIYSQCHWIWIEILQVSLCANFPEKFGVNVIVSIR